MTSCIKHLNLLDNLPEDVLTKSQKRDIFERAAKKSKDEDFKQSASDLANEYQSQIKRKLRVQYVKNLRYQRVLKSFKDDIDKWNNKERALGNILQKLNRVIQSNKAVGLGEFVNQLKQKNVTLLDFAQNPKNAVHLIDAFDDRFNQRETKDEIPQAAKDIVDIYLDIGKNQFNLAKSLGANASELDDHLAIQSHDQAKMITAFNTTIESMKARLDMIKEGISPFKIAQQLRKKAKDDWINHIKPRLDLVRTFGEKQEDGSYELNLSDKEINDALNDSYNNIVRGKIKDVNVGPGTSTTDRVFHFKDKKSWFEYHEKYGKGSLYDSMIDTLIRNGKKIGILDYFSHSPSKMFQDISEHALKTASDEEGLTAGKVDKKRFIFDGITGSDGLPESSVYEKVYNAMKVTTYLNKLGFSNFTSYPDLALQTLRYAKTGDNYFTRVGYTVENLTHFIPFTKMKNEILDSTSTGLKNYSSMFMNKYADVESPHVQRLLNIYFTATHQHGFDEALRSSTTATFSRYLYKQLGKNFDRLNDDYKNSLLSYGIDKDFFNLLSKYKDKMSVWRGKRFVFPEIISQISKEDLENLNGGKLNPSEESRLRNHLTSNIIEMYQDHASSVQLRPDNYDRSMVAINSIKNPIFRTVSKMFMDFKWFALKQTKTVLGEIYLDNSTDGLIKSIINSPFKSHMHLMQYVLQSMIMSWAADSCVSMIKYGQVEDPRDHPIRTLAKAFMGPLGLLGSLVSTATSPKDTGIKDFIGPVSSTLFDTLNLFKTLADFDSHGKRLNYHDRALRSLLIYGDRHVIPHLWQTEYLYRQHVFNPLMNKIDPQYLINEKRRRQRENPHSLQLPNL